MKILITNDDGIQAEGINALYEALKDRHECFVIAPDSERSACSHSLTTHQDIRYRLASVGFAVSGTPADCVKLGILHILDSKPDLVISGINNGSNLGSDIMYSGTVSAALEGAYLVVRSIAVSLSKHNAASEYYKRAAAFIRDNLEKLTQLDLRSDTVLNINYPVRAPFIGVKFTSSGINLYNDSFVANESGAVRLKGLPIEHDRNVEDCDVELIKKGYVTVTPLKLDRNDYAALEYLKGSGIFE